VAKSSTSPHGSVPDQDVPHCFGFRRHLPLWLRPIVAIAVSIPLCTPVLQAQPPKVSEYQVKATYLYNFARFVQWPENSDAVKGDSFSICVLGRDPFGRTLDSILAGETLDGKPLAAKRISTPRDAGDCRILFISSTEQDHLKEILDALDESSILTVSDMPEFSRRGGMIQFVLEGDRVRFEINLTKAETAKLILSSELLKVATSVRRGPHQKGL
jgi:YfiR/HmsC-like